jgi:hypothetical protein
MNVNIVNASPQVIQLGARDMSLKPQPPKPVIIPTHLQVIFGYAASGPATKELVDGARLMGLYGSETFDRSKPYFNHATRMAELMSAAGNAMMFARIIPEDNDTVANFTVYVDVLNDGVDVLQRNDDGSVYYDGNGDPVVEKTVKGHKLKVIVEYNDDDVDTSYGTKKAKTGYMTGADGETSTMYPIYEQRAAYKGIKYNNYGIAISLPTFDDLNQGYKEGNLDLPYEFSLFKREDKSSTGVRVSSLNGSKSQQFVFTKGAKDPVTRMPIDFKAVTDTWYNLTSPLRDLVYPVIDAPYVYNDNITNIAEKVTAVEAEYINANITTQSGAVINTAGWMDYIIGVDANKQARISNILTAMSSKRVPNFTFIVDESTISTDEDHVQVYPTSSTPIYFRKGKDGTLSEENFEKGVRAWMDKYTDENSEVIDTAVNLENALWDSGFTLPTKESLVSFIALRKDTFVGLSTREDKLGEKYNDLVTERAVGLNLKARLSLAPESTFFGTPVTRGIVVVGSGNDSLDPENRRYGLLHDIAFKTARMMGGQQWKRELMFDRGEKNTITNYTNIQPNFIPKGIKPDLWNIGLNWPQPFDRRSYYFPAIQSVYDDDASSMNNIFMAMALTITVKVADAAGRKFSGNIELSPSQLTEAVENYMNGELKDKFAGIITSVSKASITEFDELRGYSWSVVTKLGGEVMKTVMTHYTEVWRKGDL